MDFPIISCVIPVYNAECYIENTLKSVMKQTFQNAEIICVDDASTDRSREIIQSLVDEDKRIRIYSMSEHRGAAKCRNYGAEFANGEWIVFLDSDDFFFPNMLETAYNKIRDDIDVIIWGFECAQTHNMEETRISEMLYTKVYSEEEFSHDSITVKAIKMSAYPPWNKLVRLKMLKDKGIVFQDLPNANDLLYSLQVMLNARKILFLDKALMRYYFRRKGSISQKNNRRIYIERALSAGLEYIQSFSGCPFPEHDYIGGAVEEFRYYLTSNDYSDGAKKKLLSDIMENPVWRKAYETNGSDWFENPYLRGFWKRIIQGDYRIGENIYLCYEDSIKDVLYGREKGNVALWGIGERGKLFLDAILIMNYKVDYVIDTDTNKQGTQYKKWPIQAYSDVIGKVGTIIILNMAYFIEIKRIINNETLVYIGE